MKKDKKAILKRLHTIISKIVDVQSLIGADPNLQKASRAISYVIIRLER